MVAQQFPDNLPDDFLAQLMELTSEQWQYYALQRYGIEKVGAREMMQIAAKIGINALQAEGVNIKMPRALHISAFYDETLAPPPARVGGILPQGKLVILGGAPKEGKGLLALEILHCVAEGIPVMGTLPVMPLNEGEYVLYLGMEDGSVEIKARLEKRGAGRDLPFYICSESFDMGRPEGFILFEQLIASIAGKAVLIVIDTLRKAYPTIKDYNDAAQVAPHIGRLCDWTHDNDCTVILVHHTNKSPMATGVNRLSGSNAVASSADAFMVLYDKDAKETGFLTWKLEAAGRGGIGGEFRLRGDMETYHISIMDEDDSRAQDAKEKAEYIEGVHDQILELIEEKTEITLKEVIDAVGLSQPTATRRLAEMVKAEKIQRNGEGRKNKTYTLYSPMNNSFIHRDTVGTSEENELKKASLNTFFGDIDEKTGAVEL